MCDGGHASPAFDRPDGPISNLRKALTIDVLPSKDACNAPAPENGAAPGAANERHGTTLLSLVASQLGCKVEDIMDLELNICDTQPGVIGGAHDEFVWAGRLDNLAMSYCSLTALIETTSDAQLEVRLWELRPLRAARREKGHGAQAGRASQSIIIISVPTLLLHPRRCIRLLHCA